MTIDEMRTRLRGKVLFSDFSDQECNECLELLDPVTVESGDHVVRQDDPGDCMYILLEGTCRVIHHAGEREIEMAVLESGDFFGELSLADAGPRSADVIAVDRCVLLKITKAALGAIAGVYPGAAVKLLIGIGRTLVSRLRRCNDRYVDSLLFPVAKET